MDIFERRGGSRSGRSPGAVVKVVDHRGRPIGTAHYQLHLPNFPSASFASHGGDRPRVFPATDRRSGGFRSGKWYRDTEAYRVVHGEGDLLPALVVDRYGDYFVIQTLDQGMDAAKD